MDDRKFLALIISVSIAAKIAIVLLFLDGFGVDESIYLSSARSFAGGGAFGLQTEHFDFRFVAPLLSFVMSGFYAVLGESGALLVSPIAGSLAIIPFFYLAKNCIGKGAGKMAAVLIASNPAFFLLNTRPLTESLGLLLLSASVLVLYLMMKDKKHIALLFPPLFILTFLARYPYGIILLAIFIVILIKERKFRIFTNYDFLIGIGLAIMIILPWLNFNYQAYGNILGGPVKQGSADLGFAYEKASQYVPFLFIIAGSTFPFMIYGILMSLKKKVNPFITIGFFTLFLVQFFFFGKTVEERYILPILPFATILTIYGYLEMKKWKSYVKYFMIAAVVLNIVAAAYLINIFSSLPKYSETKEAAAWIDDNCDVVMGNLVTQLNYATEKEIIPSTTDPDVDNRMVKENDVDCFVVSEHEAPYRDFFRNDFSALRVDFGRVHVYKIK